MTASTAAEIRDASPRSPRPRYRTPQASSSGVIGDRAFHRDARVVTVLAQSLMQGLLSAGMANCGKHFPGHGFVKADSHTAIPVDSRSMKAILSDDAWPYAALGATLSSVMPAHVIYPKVDSKPAGFSERWLQEILRHELGFEGAIFSDDLSMEGARRIDGQVVSYTQAGVAALKAGCDLVLLCNQSMASARTIHGLAQGQAVGVVFQAHFAAQRILQIGFQGLVIHDLCVGAAHQLCLCIQASRHAIAHHRRCRQ